MSNEISKTLRLTAAPNKKLHNCQSLSDLGTRRTEVLREAEKRCRANPAASRTEHAHSGH